jgi:hypothetical protein
MNRQLLLLIAVVTLVVGNIGYRIWANWGLITVHATDEALPMVIRSVAKQGGIKIHTNLEADKKVTMHVDKVPLSYAMEVLANVSDARWELGYFLAPAKPDIDSALGALANGNKPEGWKRFFVPLPPGDLPGSADEGTSDPRLDTWNVKPADEPTLQAYLEQAAKNVSARIEAPKDWNPAVSAAPKGGRIQDVMPRLAKAAGGAVEQVFLLTGRRRDAERTAGGDGPPDAVRRAMFGGDDGDREKRMKDMAERMQAEINKLPEAQRATAQAKFDEGRKFFEGMKDLTPDQRRAKMEERMQDPAQQEKMFNGNAKRDAMKTPQQRADRYRSYLQNKESRISGN